MNTNSKNLNTRIAKLERTNKALVLVVGLGLVALVIGFVTRPDVVRAGAIQLLDEDGQVRAELAVQDGQPMFHLKDEHGIDRVSLFHQADGSGLFVRDAEGVTRVGAAQFAHGGGGFALHGPNSKGAAILYLKGTGSLRFLDDDGVVTNQVPGRAPDQQAE